MKLISINEEFLNKKFLIVDGQSITIPTLLVNNKNVANTYNISGSSVPEINFTSREFSLNLKYLRVLEVDCNGEWFKPRVHPVFIEFIEKDLQLYEAGFKMNLIGDADEDNSYVIFDAEFNKTYSKRPLTEDESFIFELRKQAYLEYASRGYENIADVLSSRLSGGYTCKSFSKQNLQYDVVIYRNVRCSSSNTPVTTNFYLDSEDGYMYENSESVDLSDRFCDEITDLYTVFSSQRLRLSTSA